MRTAIPVELPIFELPRGDPAGRADAAPHLRGALQADDRALPRDRGAVRHRLPRRRRRRPADRLHGPRHRGARALRRRPHEHRRHRRAPFRVLDRFDGDEYPAGEVEPIDAGRPTAPTTRRPPSIARDAFAELVERVSGEPSPTTRTLAATTPTRSPPGSSCRAETKQRLLELRDEAERMRVLGRALRALVDAVDRSREIAERAKMNGKSSGASYRRTCCDAASGNATAPPRRGSPPPLELARRRVAGDRVDAAEEDVPVRPADDLVAAPPPAARAPPRRPRARPARRRPRSGPAARSTASATSSPSRSGGGPSAARRADPVRAAAAEPDLELAVAQDDRRRHHRRQPHARPVAVEAVRVEVLLAEHVVDVDAGARDDRPEPVPFEQVTLAQPPVAVDRGDVGGRAEPVGGEPRSRDGSPEPAEEALLVRGPRGSPRCGPPAPPPSPPTIDSTSVVAEPLEQREREGDQDPARRRRRVGEHLAARGTTAATGSRAIGS